MNLSITINGQQKFNQAIGRLSGLVSDLRPVWPLVSEIFYQMENQHFASEGARGGRWKNLSPAYSKWKTRNYGDLPILYLTGAMKQSLIGFGPGSIKIETPTSLTLGTSVNSKGFYYPVAHQTGTSRLPQRKPIDLSQNDYGKFVSRMFRFFNDGVSAIGFVPSKSRGATSIQAS